MSATNSTAKQEPYVVIELENLCQKNTARPFKTVLAQPKKIDGKKPKSPFAVWFYVFKSELAAGTTYWKIGKTGDYATYHSKNRYNPTDVFDGQFQVLHYGHAFEIMVKAYLKSVACQPYKQSEWYADGEKPLKRLRDALAANPVFSDQELPIEMVNVEVFDEAYTCGMKATLTDYLSVFRVRYRNKLYKLTEENVDVNVRAMTASKYAVDAEVVAAPAVHVPSLRSSTVLSDDEESEDDATKDAQDDSSSGNSSDED